jgi:hypothetical protein
MSGNAPGSDDPHVHPTRDSNLKTRGLESLCVIKWIKDWLPSLDAFRTFAAQNCFGDNLHPGRTGMTEE